MKNNVKIVIILLLYSIFLFLFLWQEAGEGKKVLIGSGFENAYSFEGFFDYDNNLYYGLTRNGRIGRMFIYDFEKQEIEEVVELEGALGSWSILKKDDNIYIGTYGEALLYMYSIEKQSLGKPIPLPEEKFIWSMVADDHFLYIGTYPNARVYKYNLKGGRLERDYIEVENSKYVRSLSLYEELLFIGLGPEAKFFLYNISEGNLVEIELPFLEGQSFVYSQEIIDNYLLIHVSPINEFYYADLRQFDSEELIFTKIQNKKIGKDGLQIPPSYFTLARNLLSYKEEIDSFYSIEIPFQSVSVWSVDGREYFIDVDLNIYDLQKMYLDKTPFSKINLEPDSSIPMSFSVWEDSLLVGERGLRVISNSQEDYYEFTNEVKAICSLQDYLFTANYTGAIVYKIPIQTDSEKRSLDFTEKENFKIGYDQNRPRVMACNRKDNFVAIGTEPNYGRWGGALAVYNSSTGELQVHRHIIKNHNVLDLVFDPDEEGILYFTTINRGGTGTDIGDEASYLVKFNYLKGDIVFAEQVNKNKSIIRGVDLVNDVLVVRNNKKQIYKINKENGKIMDKLIGEDFTGSLLTTDGKFFLYNRKEIYQFNVENFELAKTSYQFDSLIKILELNGIIYYFDGYDYGYLK